MNIKKGDNVMIIAGKDKGRTGKVLRVFPKKDLVVVENANIKKRHQKPRKAGSKGQIIEIAAPVHRSNVMLADPKTGKPTRLGVHFENGKKTRVSKKTGAAI